MKEINQYLAHHGVKGMKWGHRKAPEEQNNPQKPRYDKFYQNPDGTLNKRGVKRFGSYGQLVTKAKEQTQLMLDTAEDTNNAYKDAPKAVREREWMSEKDYQEFKARGEKAIKEYTYENAQAFVADEGRQKRGELIVGAIIAAAGSMIVGGLFVDAIRSGRK